MNDEYDLEDEEDGTREGSCWGFEDYLEYGDDDVVVDVDVTDPDSGDVE